MGLLELGRAALRMAFVLVFSRGFSAVLLIFGLAKALR